jgi:glycosyltransferase involved in cell wall biosynthesis
MNQVTFIIPTLGRSTLERALESLKLQGVPDWKALVVYDANFDVNYESSDERITILKADVGGHAGLVRNYGIEKVQTDWMAFLDDDDWVEKTYVQKLRNYTARDPYDIVIFTYKDATNGNTVPHRRLKRIEACKVGISFAARTEFVQSNNIRFTPYAVEDFRFLDECDKAGARYIITHDLQYHVGGIGGWRRKD